MSLSSQSTSRLLQILSDYRTESIHEPHKVVQIGKVLIERGLAKKSSDQVWAFLEQVGQAALECGQIDLAQVCVTRLSTQFPASPRVVVLLGMLQEAKGETDNARQIYNDFLSDEDESNQNIRKRLIALHLHSSPSSSSSSSSSSSALSTPSSNKNKNSKPLSGAQKPLSKEEGIRLLVEYLDTFYNDPEGWSELARVYAELGLYAQSLSALSHLLLLTPHNPYALLHHAETAYTLHDYPLALKEYLRVIEMSDGVATKGGCGKRAAFGAKLCINKLSSISSAGSTTTISDPLLKPMWIDEIDLMLTQLLLNSYPLKGAEKQAVETWLGREKVSR